MGSLISIVYFQAGGPVTDMPTLSTRVKDRLTDVFTVFPDGSKAPITIVGHSRRCRSFSKHFEAMRDLGVFYYNQEILGIHKAYGTAW